MKKREKNKYYTFMLIPHDAEMKSFQIKVPTALLRFITITTLVLVALMGFSFLYSTFLSGQLIHYNAMLKLNRENTSKINEFSQKTNKIKDELQTVLDQGNHLRKLLGLKISKSKIDFALRSSEELSLAPKIKQISLALEKSGKETEESKTSLSELKSRVDMVMSRMGSTPSRWPLYGRIVSYYGYRTYPWRGFHTGVDIKARYGYPVRATAPGRVIYAGWRRGYGKTVQIKHGNGFSTLYAHNSKLTVKVGAKVGRGQVIANIGRTGYTTGPHCHYEVRRWGKPINPVAFLNLNILTASKYY